MRKARWLICDLGKDEFIRSLYYAVKETGREAEVVPLRTIAEMYEAEDLSTDCVITMGSIWMNKALREVRPNWIGNYHDDSLFDCTRYYGFWGKYIVQENYAFYPVAEVIRQKDMMYRRHGKGLDGGSVFIRPSSGEKSFNGELVHLDRFDAWASHVLEYSGTNPATLCVVAEPVHIEKELRLVIADKKVVTGSTYRIAGHLLKDPLEQQDDKEAIIEFAESVLADSGPPLPPIHCLDIAVTANKDKYRIMEVGCVCCAGMYECDRRKLAVGISEAVERDFREVFRTEPYNKNGAV